MRLLKRVLSELKTTPGLYLLSTLVVALCLAIFAFFGLIYLNLDHFTKEIARELVLNVYLRSGLEKEEALRLAEKLKEDPLVAGVKYLSSKEVLAELKALFEDRDLLAGVEPSFLPSVLVVSFRDPFAAVPRLPELAASLKAYPGVEKVQYARSWLLRLAGLEKFLELLFVSGLLLLGVGTVFIIGLTVKFSLSERREELEILSLVGATPGFIQTPLLILAFFQGLLAGVLALLLIYFLKLYLDRVLVGLFPGFTAGLLFFAPYQWGILLTGVVVLCLFGSYWASRRYLRY